MSNAGRRKDGTAPARSSKRGPWCQPRRGRGASGPLQCVPQIASSGGQASWRFRRRIAKLPRKLNLDRSSRRETNLLALDAPANAARGIGNFLCSKIEDPSSSSGGCPNLHRELDRRPFQRCRTDAMISSVHRPIRHSKQYAIYSAHDDAQKDAFDCLYMSRALHPKRQSTPLHL